MDVNIDNLNRLNELIGVHFHRKHVLVVEPEKNEKEEQIGEDIVYDKVPWKISEDDKKYLGEYHHARKQEYEYRYPQIEDEQEEHHSQTVDDLRYRQIVIVVILDFCFHHVLTGRPVVC